MEWPTHGRAKDARDRSYEEAVAGMRALRPVMLRSADCTESALRAAEAYTRLERIARMMLAQGAPGRPEAEQ